MIVDCDAHVLEPATLWQEYLEPEFGDRAVRIEENEGLERLIIGEQIVLEGVVAGLCGVEAELFSRQLSYRHGNAADTFGRHARAARMDQWGIDKTSIFPTIGFLPFAAADHALANAYCRAYNNWVNEFRQSVPARFHPIALVNWRDTDEAP